MKTPRGRADPAGIEVVLFYEVWNQQPDGGWVNNSKKVFTSKREAKAYLREMRDESAYTKSLKWRVYRVRKALNRERM